jgi:site-specific DNA recombinase
VRVSRSGRKSGGTLFARGALYKLLTNRTYLGEVPHKDKSYPGEHQAIIDQELWEKVRDRMTEGIRGKRFGRDAAAPSLLRGLVYDEQGNRYTPSHAVKRGKRYRYYVSQLLIHDPAAATQAPGRIPARELERAVLTEFKSFLGSPDQVTATLGAASDDVASTQKLMEGALRAQKEMENDAPSVVSEFLAGVTDRIVVREDALEIQLRRESCRSSLMDPVSRQPNQQLPVGRSGEEIVVLNVAAKLWKYRGEVRLIIPSRTGALEPGQPIPSLLKAIARAQDWVAAIVAGKYKDQRAIAAALGVNERYVSNMIGAAFLAPRIIDAIANGNEHPEMNLAGLLDNIALSWKEQCARLRRPA